MINTYIALGYRCNHHCLTCPLSKGRYPNTRLSDIMSMLHSLSAGDHVTFSGGEPTLYAELFPALSYCLKNGINVSILTNASSFSNEKYVNSFIEIDNSNKVNIVTSLYHVDPKKHDYLTGVDGSFATSIKSIENLICRGHSVTMKIIVSKINIKVLKEMVAFLLGKFPLLLNFQFTCIDYSGMASKYFENCFVTFDKMRPYLEEAIDYILDNSKANISLIEIPFCAIDPYYWKFFSRKNLKLSNYLAPKNDNESLVIHNLKNKCNTLYSACKNCDIREFCHGAWESTIVIGGESMLHPIKCED